MFIGFESGNQRVLNFLRKGTTVEQNYRAAKICRKYGIKIWANYMVGIPTETKKEVIDTVNMIKKIRPEHYSPAFYTPAPGSDLFAYCEKNNLSLIKNHDNYRRNPTKAKIKGLDYKFLNWAVMESMGANYNGKLKRNILRLLSFCWNLVPRRVKQRAIKNIKNFHQLRPYEGKEIEIYGDEEIKETRINGEPLVSIIIPTKNKARYLKVCLEGIEKNTEYRKYEIIITDNNTNEKEAIKILKEVQKNYKVLKYPYQFNFSKINNFASTHAKGKYLVFLNNDTIPQKNWLRPLISICQQKNMGIVGSKLIYPNGRIQHAGIKMCKVNEGVEFFHRYLNFPSNYKEANKIKECIAVTGACMMIKRSLFEKVGGFDENYWVESQDIDLCFKVRNKGYKVVYNPNSVLYHNELTTRGRVPKSIKLHDSSILKNKWRKNRFI